MDIRPIGSGAQPSSTAPPPIQNSEASTSSAAPTSASTGVAQPQPEPSIGQVNDAVQKINTTLAAQSQGIEFAIDSTSHRIVVKVVDQSTNEVLREIPSKEALAIADSIDQSSGQPGLLIKQQA